MGKTTDISWTDHTFNPHWGCFKVSPGCTNCYAETFAKRVGQQIWGPPKTTERRLFGDKHWAEPLHWNAEAEKAGERRRVFCASMADVFEDHPQLPPVRRRLWNLIEDTPYLDWLLLTKRPENIATMLPQKYWPNVWLGTSTEDQQRADERVPVLLRYRDRVPVLFLSVEPQIGPISLRRYLELEPTVSGGWMRWSPDPRPLIDWVIVGGESGPKHRPFDEDWARSLRDQCQAAGVAFHYKQFGGRTHAEGGCLLDGREHKEFPEPRREVAHV
jgi:protein gp37